MLKKDRKPSSASYVRTAALWEEDLRVNIIGSDMLQIVNNKIRGGIACLVF